MSTPEQEPFSYAKAARLLQTARGSTDEKLDTARDLLKRKLVPHPAPLILRHIFYTLKNSPKESNDQFSHYWTLLHDTLKEAVQKSEYVPEFPDTLLRDAAEHILQPSCTKPVAQAMNIVLKFPVPQSLQDFGVLLRNITTLLPRHPHLHSLALSVLKFYGQIQRQEQDHKKMISICLPLLEPFLSSSILRRPAEPVLTHAFFSEPNLSRDDIIAYMSKSAGDHLSDTTRFLLSSYAQTERRRTRELEESRKTASLRSAMGRSKRGRPLSELHHLLRFFRDLVSALSQNLVQEQSLSLPRVNALRALFETAAGLDLYRPSFDDLSFLQPEKKVKKSAQASGVRAVAQEIREAFKEVCKSLLKLCSQTTVTDVSPLCSAATSIVKLSVDTVDNLLQMLLQSCCHRDHADACGQVFCELLELYAVSRAVPRFFGHFIKAGCSLFGMYQFIFVHDDVRKSLARTVFRLPTGQAEKCIQTIAIDNMKPDDAQSVAFLSAIIIESSRDDRSQLIRVVCSEVVRKIASLDDECTSIRCAWLFLLSSLLFAVVKANVTLDGDTFQVLLKCGIMQAACRFPFGIDDILDFQRKFVEKMEEEDLDPVEKYCCVRLLSVLVHIGVREDVAQENYALTRRLLELLFTYTDALFPLERKEQLIPNPFYEGTTYDEIVPIVLSVTDVIELAYKDNHIPHGYLTFLRFLVNKYPVVPDLWSDILEKKVVQHAFPKVIQGILKKEEEGSRANVNLLSLFKLLLHTPSGYMPESEEKRIEKRVRRMYLDLSDKEEQTEALNVLMKFGICNPMKLKSIIEESVVHSLNSSILTKLSERAAETVRVSSKSKRRSQLDDVVRLTEYVLEKWTKNSKEQGMVHGFVSNVEAALRLPFFNSRVIALALDRLVEVLKESCQACKTSLQSKTDASIPHALRIVSSVLGIWDHVVRNSAPDDIERNEAIQACIAFLMETMEHALSSSVKIVLAKDKNGKHDEIFASARDLLLGSCQYVPRRSDRFSSETKSGFATSRHLAHALYFLYDQSAAIRTIGVEMMSVMCSFESEEVIRVIGSTIMKAFDDELSSMIRGSIEPAQEVKQMEQALDTLYRAQGNVLAAGAALCGSRSSSEEQTLVLNERNEFSHFVSARHRRDLSGIQLSRELSAQIVVRLMQALECLIGFLGMLYRNFEQAKSMAREKAEALERIAWSCVLVGLDACETTVARRAPHRLENDSVQEVLQSLAVVVRFTHENEKRFVGREEQMVVKVMRICRYVLHVHGNVGRWTCMGLVRRAVEQAGKKGGSCETGVVVGDVLREFVECGAGKEIVGAALADCCDRLGRGCSAEFRRGVFGGVVSMMKALDDEDARRILVGMSENGQEVMRQAREVYMEERYRGK